MFSKWSHQNIFAHFLVLTRPKPLLFSNKRKRVNIGQNAFTLNQGDTPLRSHSSAPESYKQNPRDRTLALHFFFRYKHIPSLENLPSPAPNESLPYWFQGNFVASFVLNFCLREFLLSADANRFELRCEPKQLMLLYYKICPCSLAAQVMVLFASLCEWQLLRVQVQVQLTSHPSFLKA